MKIRLLAVVALAVWAFVARTETVFLECEAFDDCGGWVNDTQFIDQMGSPYLLAHGLGKPVADAKTTFIVRETGAYDVWVRTKNWTAPWHAGAGAGAFQLVVNGKVLPKHLGVQGNGEWQWVRVERVQLESGENTLALHDLDGFDGRCDAVVFTTETEVGRILEGPRHPSRVLKRRQLPIYDLCVVGGGIAGICTAVSAARLGLSVALVQDRPILGGNNSSEVRVHLGAWQNMPPYPRLGDVLAEFGSTKYGNAEPAANYGDDAKMRIVAAETNITLFMNRRVTAVATNRIGRIIGVSAVDTRYGDHVLLEAKWFADCTGDGTVGYLAGADSRMGREAKSETGEPWAPEKPDMLTMGASVQWRAKKNEKLGMENGKCEFPLRNWMIRFTDENGLAQTKGDWDWEAGLGRDQIKEAELIRDYGLLVAYSNWAFAKNVSKRKEEFKDQELEWVAYIAGRRESRRLMGDFVLSEKHILERDTQPDGTCAATWTIDLHFPKTKEQTKFTGEPFRSNSENEQIWPYPIPYRCFYSRNVPNLFMAGRDISVTHIALGTTRLMRTIGMMGEVVGMAASVCKKHGCDPRSVYTDHWDELKALMEKGVGDGKPHPPQMYNIQDSLDPRFKDQSAGNYQLVSSLSLNGEWDFCFEEGKSIEEAQKADFVPTGKMSVPGCYDAQGALRFKRGTGLYRRTFTLAKSVDNAWLVINGMGLRGSFEIDGKSLGVHPYPYARLELETGSLAAGEHTIFAAIDNRLDWRTMKLARTFYDFYFFGGFYRDVELKFDNTKILVRTRDYRTGEVEIEVAGVAGERTLIFDGTNKVKAVFKDGKTCVKVPNFKMWSPAHPNLHTVTLSTASPYLAPVRFGIRTIEAKDKKIYLNGEPIFLKGVNRHEQSRGRGVTMTRDECVRDLKILKELGANFIRGAHYQQDPKFLDLCDEMGFLVWEESLGWGNGQDYTKAGSVEELKDETFIAQQLHTTREMVKASFNHPSVIIYGFLNECGSHKKECKELVDQLIDEIRALESGRLITFACNVCDRDICHERTDIIAFNAYPGTIPARPGTPSELRAYVKKDFDKSVARFRKWYPEKPIMVSESGCAGFYGLRDESAAFGTEDFQNEYLTDILDALWANEDVAGFAIWQFADSTTHQRNSAGKSGRIFGFSMAGLYDFDRRPKLSVETVKRYFATKNDTFDIVIYGSSPAAISAAIQAGRMGKRAVIVSPETRIGGLTTGGLGQTDIGNKSAFGGIALEFYRAVAEYYRDDSKWTHEKRGDYLPDGQCEGTKGEDSMWTFEPSAALSILTRWEKEYQLDIRRGKRLDRSVGKVKVEGEGEQRRIVSFVTEDGTEFRGKMFIDATYEGDLMAAAGVSFTIGREANAVYGESINGIETKLAKGHQFGKGIDPYVKKGDPKSGLLPNVEPFDPNEKDGDGDRRVQAYCFRMCLTDDLENRIPFAKPANYQEEDYELLFRQFESEPLEAYAGSLKWKIPWINSRMPNRKTDTNNCLGFSTDFIGRNWSWPEASYEEREQILREHLQYQRGLMWTLANHPRVPPQIRAVVSCWGTCKDEFLDGLGDGWQSQLYVREARRMIGEMVMTEHHCLRKVVAERPIAMAAYTMDSHNVRRHVGADGFVHNEGNIEFYGIKPYPIDYGAIIPKKAECTNLLVPVCLSASHMAFGSIRMEPVFFALGQAAATAAAQAIDVKTDLQDIPYAPLANRLCADGQVLKCVE